MGQDKIMTERVQRVGGDTGDDMRANHIQRFCRQTAGTAHRGKILRPVYRNSPGIGAAIHHTALSVMV
jgi:hypothetical protein